MGQSSWLVAGIVPGIERQPLKKLTADQDGLLQLLHRWRKEAAQTGHTIKRIAVAYEAGRDGFWLARWLRAREIEAYVIHPSSVPVSRRRIVSIPSYSSGPFSAGCAVNQSTAAWPRSRPSRMRMQSGRAANAKAWSGNARALSTE
jgi:transposase